MAEHLSRSPTGQELLALVGADQYLPRARWSADGDVILAGPPWQAWIAPSWEEIEAAEAKEPPSSDSGKPGPPSSELGGQGKTEIQEP